MHFGNIGIGGSLDNQVRSNVFKSQAEIMNLQITGDASAVMTKGVLERKIIPKTLEDFTCA